MLYTCVCSLTVSIGRLSQEGVSLVLKTLESRGELHVTVKWRLHVQYTKSYTSNNTHHHLSCMCKGNVEWQNTEKTRCLVMWRSPREWGELIYRWV